MNITDDIERSGFGFLIVVERHSLEHDRFCLFRGGQNKDVTKILPFQTAERAAQVLELVMGYVIAKPAVGADMVAILTDSLRHV